MIRPAGVLAQRPQMMDFARCPKAGSTLCTAASVVMTLGPIEPDRLIEYDRVRFTRAVERGLREPSRTWRPHSRVGSIMPALDREGDLHILDLGGDGNRFTPQFVAEVGALVEEVAATPPPRALVTTASGEAWALGLDLEWIAENPEQAGQLLIAMHDLDARMLELPVPTVAAIDGHAYASGALFALAHDSRVMRADRGFFCLPEIDGQIAFTPGLTALVRARLAPQAAPEMLTTGARYGGRQALARGIVDRIVDHDTLAPGGERPATPRSQGVAPVARRAERLASRDGAGRSNSIVQQPTSSFVS